MNCCSIVLNRDFKAYTINRPKTYPSIYCPTKTGTRQISRARFRVVLVNSVEREFKAIFGGNNNQGSSKLLLHTMRTRCLRPA